MPRNVQPPRHPDAGEPADVVKQPLQPRGACRMADQPLVQADRQHARLDATLAVEEIERVAAINKEVVARRERTSAEF